MKGCPINKVCPCPEYSKEFLCDYPYRNSDVEVRAVQLWGYRLPQVQSRCDRGITDENTQ